MATTSPLKRAGTSHDEAYDRLHHAIRQHDIAPGARINEVETAARLGVSRTPLRQALWRLVAEGFVGVQPGAGFHARVLDAKVLGDLRETLLLVELTALDLSITRAEAASVDALLARWEHKRAEKQASRARLTASDEAFHLELAALSGNAELVLVVTRLQDMLHGTRATQRSDATQRAADRLALLHAVQSRKRPAARKALAELLRCELMPRPVAHPDAQATIPARRAAETIDDEAGSVTSRIYAQIRRKLIGFELRPGERLREQEIAEAAGASRPSVREALSRLVAEKLVVWEANRGFRLRTLNTQEIFNLFELRAGLESQMVSLAIARASDAQLKSFSVAWHSALARVQAASQTELIREDEAFHARLATIANNAVLHEELERIATRIHFVRGIDLRQQSGEWLVEHSQITHAVEQRDVHAASTLMHAHLARLFEEIHAALKIGIAELYVH